MTSDLTLYGISAAPVILALTQLAKEAGLPSRFAPIVSLLLGIVAGVAAQFSLVRPDYVQGAVIGIAVGLAASGLYAGTAAFTRIESAPTPTAPVPPATPSEPPA